MSSNATAYVTQDKRINVKELSRLFNLAKGYRNTNQFLSDCGITFDKQPIIDILNERYNASIRIHHLRKITQNSEGRVNLNTLADLLGITIDNSIQELIDIQINRGDIYMVDLGNVLDQEQGGIRPALIIQNNMGNERSSTVQIIPYTSAIGKRTLPTHVIMGFESGLYKDSEAMVEQSRCISKRRLLIDGDLIKVGQISDILMKRVEAAIKIEFGINEVKFNYAIVEKLIIAIKSVVNYYNKTLDNNLKLAKNLLLRDLIDYCNDYNKDYKLIIEEYNKNIIVQRGMIQNEVTRQFATA